MTDHDESSTLNETYAALHTLLLSLVSVEDFLQDLARLAAEITPAISCGITVEYDGRPLTVSSSDDWALTLDEVQYDVGEGPCLQAMRTGTAVHVGDVSHDERWPGYIELARSEGLHESLSLPLIVSGKSTGAVNLYSRERLPIFVGEVRRRADLFVAQASTALLLAVRQFTQTQANRDLETALVSRSVIDQAIGVVMGQQGCTAEEAFALLRQHSQNNNRKLRDVASDLVDRTDRIVW